MSRHSTSPVMAAAAAAVFTYAIHFVWEMAQSPLFEGMVELPFWTAAFLCARASLGDVGITFVAYVSTAAVQRDRFWPARESSRLGLIVFLTVGLTITILIELWATSIGRWRYKDVMPTILGVGLGPLGQWIVLPLLTYAALRRLLRR